MLNEDLIALQIYLLLDQLQKKLSLETSQDTGTAPVADIAWYVATYVTNNSDNYNKYYLLLDNITDGDKQTSVLKNAPLSREGFYAVPKVVE